MTAEERIRLTVEGELPDRAPVWAQLSAGSLFRNGGLPPVESPTRAQLLEAELRLQSGSEAPLPAYHGGGSAAESAPSRISGHTIRGAGEDPSSCGGATGNSRPLSWLQAYQGAAAKQSSE